MASYNNRIYIGNQITLIVKLDYVPKLANQGIIEYVPNIRTMLIQVHAPQKFHQYFISKFIFYGMTLYSIIFIIPKYLLYIK